MSRRLMLAHLHNSVDELDEVERLLVDLRESWNAIGEQQAAAPAAVPAVPAAAASPYAPAMDPLAPRSVSFVSA
jgi:hypothetical protein